MFFFRHPQPVRDSRAVAVLVVEQEVADEFNNRVIVVDANPPKLAARNSVPNPHVSSQPE